jgi:hypothetical protein
MAAERLTDDELADVELVSRGVLFAELPGTGARVLRLVAEVRASRELLAREPKHLDWCDRNCDCGAVLDSEQEEAPKDLDSSRN